MAWLRESTVPEYAPVKRDIGVADFFAAAGTTSIRRVVLVQAGTDPVETAWLLDVADSDDGIAGVVGWVTLESADATRRQLESLAPRRKLVGIRHMDGWPPDGSLLKTGVGYASAQVLADEDIVLDVAFGPPEDLRHVSALAKRVPALRIVVDHLGIPPGRQGEGFFDRWSQEMSAIALLPNVSVKYSGWTTRLPEVRVDAVAPYIDYVLHEFGASRVMFAGNWPICTATGDYRTMFETSLGALAALDDAERQAVLAGTAASVYRLGENVG